MCIPKVIHYCWFGRNPLSPIAKKCIESWKKYCPDYNIIEWNEENFDVNIIKYTQEAYDAKKYAFVSDYARFFILYTYGGIYMDVDVELIKPLDIFLDNKMFAGFEDDKNIAPGLIFASTQGQSLIKEIMDSYNSRCFLNDGGSFNYNTVVEFVTEILRSHGLLANGKSQTVEGMKLYPRDFFCPMNFNTGKINITTNTYSIHHFDGSWQSNTQKFKVKIKRVFGEKFLIGLSKFKKLILGAKT